MKQFAAALLGMSLLVYVFHHGEAKRVHVPVYIQACPDTVVTTINRDFRPLWNGQFKLFRSDTTTVLHRCKP